MTSYYLGGYYLIQQRPIDFGSFKSEIVHTCSNCINDSLLEHWSYSWTTNNDLYIEEIKQDYLIDDETISSIRSWIDKAFNDKKIGWINLFKNIDTAKEYRHRFFSHLPETKILGIYFTGIEREKLLNEFKPQNENLGSIGLYDNLQKEMLEKSLKETLLGHDIIGIEIDGSFHSFYCHDISKDLIEKFDLTINNYGLFEDSEKWQSVLNYMNDEQNGFEPVPWFVCKTKLATE